MTRQARSAIAEVAGVAPLLPRNSFGWDRVMVHRGKDGTESSGVKLVNAFENGKNR